MSYFVDSNWQLRNDSETSNPVKHFIGTAKECEKFIDKYKPSKVAQLIEELARLKPYHISPYNLGEEGRIGNIIDELANIYS